MQVWITVISLFVFVNTLVKGLTLQETTRLTLNDGLAGDYFGGAFGVSGNTMVVGAPTRNMTGNRLGAAFVYERNFLGEWHQTYVLQPSDLGFDNRFGTVAISGDTIAVGAWKRGGGEVFMFQRNHSSSNWTEITRISGHDTGFGRFLAISNDTLVVAANQYVSELPANGTAYVFHRNEGGANNWGLVKKLMEPVNMGFPFVSVRGDTIFVGAQAEGAAYLFERHTWGREIKLTPNGGATDSLFGCSGDVDGDTLVIGAPGDAELGANSGAVYVYRRDSNAITGWTQVTKLSASDASDGANFGFRVTIWKDWIAVGALHGHSSGVVSGSAYLFETKDGLNWEEKAILTPSVAAPNMYFGHWVSLERNTILVGSPNDNSTGSVHIFDGDWHTTPSDDGWTWACNCNLSTQTYTECLNECRLVRGHWAWTCDHKFPKTNYTHTCKSS